MNVEPPGVAGNDSDADGDPLVVSQYDTVSTLGALVTIDPDDGFRYDPVPSVVLQVLTATETQIDEFWYTVDDGRGGEDSAVVTVAVTGVVAEPDEGDGPEDPGDDAGGPDEPDDGGSDSGSHFCFIGSII